jgi:hypothetical protein
MVHQKADWASQQAAEDYLQWLREQADRLWLVFWDLHTAQCHGHVKELAKSLCIHLKFMLAGMADCCQPLDQRIVGVMKEPARARIEGHMELEGYDAMTIPESVVTLL